MKITRSITNIPILELDLFCQITGATLDVENEEIVILKIDKIETKKKSI